MLDVGRGGLELQLEVAKGRGRAARRRGRTRRCSTRSAPATTTASSASSTSCRPGMRQSLYLKDDDYRLSFLYGNFTTLTRFTEADLERVVTEGLSPLQRVSIHATDPDVRADDAAQPPGRHQPALAAGAARPRHRGARPGRRAAPGVNDGAVLDDTLAGVLDQYPELATRVRRARSASAATTPRPRMRPHTRGEAAAVLDAVARLAGRVPAPSSAAAWCSPPTSTTCWPAGRSPTAEAYEGFAMHEDGIGMARTFELEFRGQRRRAPPAPQPGFFAWVDGAPAEGYRRPGRRPSADPRRDARRRTGGGAAVALRPRRRARSAILTGALRRPGARPRWSPALDRDDVRVIPVENRFFGGNIGVTGLHGGRGPGPGAGRPSPRATATCCPTSACRGGRFLDGTTPDDLPRPVEVVATDGAARCAGPWSRAGCRRDRA